MCSSKVEIAGLRAIGVQLDFVYHLVDCTRHDQFFDFTVTGLVTNTHEFTVPRGRVKTQYRHFGTKVASRHNSPIRKMKIR